MKKPHEEVLTDESGIGEDNKGDTWLFRDVDEAVAIVLAEAGPDWVALFKSAPDMARALLEVKGDIVAEDGHVGFLHITTDTFKSVMAALEKAGAL